MEELLAVIGVLVAVLSATTGLVMIGLLVWRILKWIGSVRSTARREILSLLRDAHLPIATDADCAEVFIRGAEGYDSLPSHLKLRFHIICVGIFRGYEALWLDQKRLDRSFFQSHFRALGCYLECPGIREWWNQWRDAHTAGFAKAVNDLAAAAAEGHSDDVSGLEGIVRRVHDVANAGSTLARLPSKRNAISSFHQRRRKKRTT